MAVDGFLTFLVADDTAGVVLSRTTRRRFLEDLAIEIALDKKNYSEPELISYIEEFSKKYAYPIKATNFLNGFLEKDILRFKSGSIEFSLPFIESYLLAVSLSRNEKSASTYFFGDLDGFDHETFDLYSEMGPHPSIVSKICGQLQLSIEQLEPSDIHEHILLSGTVRPKLLYQDQSRVEKVKSGLKNLIEKLQDAGGSSNEKQRLLDIADRAMRQANSEVGGGGDEGEKGDAGRKGETDIWLTAARHWYIGTILLGSASERLLADEKVRIGADLVKLGTLIIDRMTRDFMEVDFEKVKSDVLNSKDVHELVKDNEANIEKAEIEHRISQMIDLIEHSILSRPFRALSEQICEQANNPVLSMTLKEIDYSSGMEGVIAALWHADLDAAVGLKRLRGVVKTLPLDHFFRITLVGHIVHRVYWTHWNENHRKQLLEIANDILKPLGQRYDKRAVLSDISKKSKK